MEVETLDDKVDEFIKSLDPIGRGKISRMIDLLEKYGNKLGMPHGKKLISGIYELRTKGRPAIRLFYAYHKEKIWILHGFIKKTNKTPTKELQVACNKLSYLHVI